MLGGSDQDQQLGELAGDDRTIDKALAALYDAEEEPALGERRRGGLGSSAPKVTRWLGDIRQYFPNRVVQVMQRDAIERLDLVQLLLEPEMLESVEPDVHLVHTLVQLSSVMPQASRDTARRVVRKVVEQVEQRIADKTRAAVTGALKRTRRTRRPLARDIDWNRTIAANLKHYLPEHRTVVPERLVGYGRYRQGVQRDVIVAIDQSASMAESVVYASIFGSVLAGVRAVKTSVVVFDTEVADLTDRLADPVDVLFGTQLGGGTDINKAVAYCQGLITNPRQSVFVLISDLFEGGIVTELLRRMRSIAESGVQVVTLLALNDSGTPSFDHQVAAALAELGLPAFGCTPDAFPDLLATAIEGGSVRQWNERYAAERAAPSG